MRISALSVQRYRSIESTKKLDIGDYTVLVGPNNEGKSNILRALALGMRLLQQYGLRGSRFPDHRSQRAEAVVRSTDYEWIKDYPKHLQSGTSKGKTQITLWFRLSDLEQEDFAERFGSRLKTDLPIRLTIQARRVEFKVSLRGPANKRLNAQSGGIADFIGQRIGVQYVEAVRTARHARRAIDFLLERELHRLSGETEIGEALERLEAALYPTLEALGEDVTATLQRFMPDLHSVNLELSTSGVLQALSNGLRITLDDGAPTALEDKGDGAQSLATLALTRGWRQQGREEGLVLALEEPESHLHPNAVHQLRSVLREISETQQVVVSTHNPILVNRTSLRSNILVQENNARCADRISEIRHVLGVAASDNLRAAQVVLLVEGANDHRSLLPLISAQSAVLKEALNGGLLAIESLDSASNLTARVQHLKAQLCQVHAFLDDDQAARDAFAIAEERGILEAMEVNFATCPGRKQSEFEDLVSIDLYSQLVLQGFGCDLTTKSFSKSKTKWSVRLEDELRKQGKPTDLKTKAAIKRMVSEAVMERPDDALRHELCQSFDSLVLNLQKRLGEQH